jgi:hypothetical protein
MATFLASLLLSVPIPDLRSTRLPRNGVHIDCYLQFHASFHAIKNRGAFDREIDRALWTFGKMLSEKNWNLGR